MTKVVWDIKHVNKGIYSWHFEWPEAGGIRVRAGLGSLEDVESAITDLKRQPGWTRD